MSLSEAERNFQMEPRLGVLAVINPDGLPQQAVVWYDLQGDEILTRTDP